MTHPEMATHSWDVVIIQWTWTFTLTCIVFTYTKNQKSNDQNHIHGVRVNKFLCLRVRALVVGQSGSQSVRKSNYYAKKCYRKTEELTCREFLATTHIFRTPSRWPNFAIWQIRWLPPYGRQHWRPNCTNCGWDSSAASQHRLRKVFSKAQPKVPTFFFFVFKRRTIIKQNKERQANCDEFRKPKISRISKCARWQQVTNLNAKYSNWFDDEKWEFANWFLYKIPTHSSCFDFND